MSKQLKWDDNRPNKIKIKSKYITIRPKNTDTQLYLERLMRYEECAKWIVEVEIDNEIDKDKLPDQVEFIMNTNLQKFADDLEKVDYTELREIYPNIKYSRSKKGFIENIIRQIEN